MPDKHGLDWYVLIRGFEYQIVSCNPGSNPLYGYGSWNLYSGPHESFALAEADAPDEGRDRVYHPLASEMGRLSMTIVEPYFGFFPLTMDYGCLGFIVWADNVTEEDIEEVPGVLEATRLKNTKLRVYLDKRYDFQIVRNSIIDAVLFNMMKSDRDSFLKGVKTDDGEDEGSSV